MKRFSSVVVLTMGLLAGFAAQADGELGSKPADAAPAAPAPPAAALEEPSSPPESPTVRPAKGTPHKKVRKHYRTTLNPK